MSRTVDQDFVRQMKKKVDEELTKKEKEVLTYWRGELDKVVQRRHQDLAALTNDLKLLADRMDKRLRVL